MMDSIMPFQEEKRPMTLKKKISHIPTPLFGTFSRCPPMSTSSMSQQAIEHNIPAKSALQKPTQLNVNMSAVAKNALNKMK